MAREKNRYNLLDYKDGDAAERYAEKHDWGYSRKELTAMARSHYKGSERQKAIIQERLTAANYHKYSKALDRDDYKTFHSHMQEEYANDKPTKGENDFFATVARGASNT